MKNKFGKSRYFFSYLSDLAPRDVPLYLELGDLVVPVVQYVLEPLPLQVPALVAGGPPDGVLQLPDLVLHLQLLLDPVVGLLVVGLGEDNYVVMRC